MEAIRKITTIKNAAITFSELGTFENQQVEVIIFPLVDDSAKKKLDRKAALLKYAGAIESEFTDTSLRVDELVYGK